jgi:hypothetical protein
MRDYGLDPFWWQIVAAFWSKELYETQEIVEQAQEASGQNCATERQTGGKGPF